MLPRRSLLSCVDLRQTVNFCRNGHTVIFLRSPSHEETRHTQAATHPPYHLAIRSAATSSFDRDFSEQKPRQYHSIMSFLFGGGRPQPSSAEKLSMAEAELELITDMYNKYVYGLRSSIHLQPNSVYRKPALARRKVLLGLTSSRYPQTGDILPK